MKYAQNTHKYIYIYIYIYIGVYIGVFKIPVDLVQLHYKKRLYLNVFQCHLRWLQPFPPAIAGVVSFL